MAKARHWDRLPDALQHRIMSHLDLRSTKRVKGPDFKQKYSLKVGRDGRKTKHRWFQADAVLSVSKAFARTALTMRADLLEAALTAHRAAFAAWAARLVAGETVPFTGPPVPKALEQSCFDGGLDSYRPWVASSWIVVTHAPDGMRRWVHAASGCIYCSDGPPREGEAARPGHPGTGVRYEKDGWTVVQHEAQHSPGRPTMATWDDLVCELLRKAANLDV